MNSTKDNIFSNKFVSTQSFSTSSDSTELFGCREETKTPNGKSVCYFGWRTGITSKSRCSKVHCLFSILFISTNILNRKRELEKLLMSKGGPQIQSSNAVMTMEQKMQLADHLSYLLESLHALKPSIILGKITSQGKQHP